MALPGTVEDIQKTLLDFLEQELLVDREQEAITPTTNLLEGLLDSLGTLRLMVFLEETYGIQVADGDLVPENFESVERVAAYVGRQSQ